MSTYDHDTSSLNYEMAVERTQFNLVAFLKPKLSVDGNQYCFLYGENLQDGVTGFGDSPAHAAEDFSRNWYKSLQNKKKVIR